MTQLTFNPKQIPPVVSVARTPATPADRDGRDPATDYKIIDRVTISRRARLMSQQYVNVTVDSSAPSILSYEVRKPFTIHGSEKKTTILAQGQRIGDLKP